MKYCYGYKADGKFVRLAKIYTQQEHGIIKTQLDKHALNIIYRLFSIGYEAYIVGGAVRDLLSKKVPKDFDIVTNARPKEIKRNFKYARIIGKRFQIVLIPITNNHNIEISTFRSDQDLFIPNVEVHPVKKYGTIVQDVKRRDFSVNALYYCPIREELFDFVNGFEHLKNKKLIPILTQYKKDPVRLLRAVKYSNKVQLQLTLMTKINLYCNAFLLQTVSRSRMSDEIMKILTSGYSYDIIKDCIHYRLLKYMLPNVYKWGASHKTQFALLLKDLQFADSKVEEPYNRIRGFQMIINRYVLFFLTHELSQVPRKKITQQYIGKLMDMIKQWIYPMTPPNSEIQSALMSILREAGLISSHSKATRSKEFSSRSRHSRPVLSVRSNQKVGRGARK